MTYFSALQAFRIIVPSRCRGFSEKQKYMPEVKFDEKLKEENVYKTFLERKNIERAAIAKRNLRKNRITMTTCLTIVISIYIYTIVKMKQEIFLDDFEEPKRIPKEI